MISVNGSSGLDRKKSKRIISGDFMSASSEVKGGIAVITMNNPPVNGLGHATRSGIFDGLKKALTDSAVKAVVITGAISYRSR